MLLTTIALFTGYIFLNTGIEKALHVEHTAADVRRLVPECHRLAKPIAVGTMVLELTIALSLLIYPLILVGLFASVLVLTAFVVVVSSTLSRQGSKGSCGCGPRPTALSGATVMRNGALSALATVGLGLRAFGPDSWVVLPASVYHGLAVGLAAFLYQPR